MFSSNLSRRVSGFLAAAIILALPGTTLAVSQTASETLTVDAQITLTGVPASLAYGSALAGNALSAPAFSVALSTNNPTGATFSVAASDLTSTGGTIASTNRAFNVGGTGFLAGAYEGPAGTKQALTTFSSPNPGAVLSVVSQITIPADAVPGAYTGSVTFHFDVNP